LTAPYSAPWAWDAPGTAIAQNLLRDSPASNVAVLTSAQLYLCLIWLPACVLTSITWVSATTALGTGANQWFGIFDTTYVPLRLTSDDTTTAWAANTAKTLNLSSTLAITTAGLYYAGIMVKATTVPTLTSRTAASNQAVQAIAPVRAGTSSGALTNPASCPNPAAAPTATGNIPYVYVS
jgi:hypothetical protein